MKFHWKVLLWMLAGALVGVLLRNTLASPSSIGGSWRSVGDGRLQLVEVAPGGPLARAGIAEGAILLGHVADRGLPSEALVPAGDAEAFGRFVEDRSTGTSLWLQLEEGKPRQVTVELEPTSTLAQVLAPIDFFAEVFKDLLKMLIVPIVFTSIVTGVAGVGNMKDLRRLGGKTIAYYVTTSLLAILVGQVLVTMFAPGAGASLGLAGHEVDSAVGAGGFGEFLRRMVPSNVFQALGSNGAMLSIIFFALLFGLCVTRAAEPHGSRVKELFESLFQVILKLAEGIMLLLPYGVFFLLARVVAMTGLEVFKPLLAYMGIVALALVLHACVTLPLIVRFVGQLSPRRWFAAMSPALMTAFSTSSSSATLPVTLETVERRGKVSNRITSFTLPLGATVNMDGTALYECIGVIFLAQYYASAGAFDLTLAVQVQVVVMALLASIGAAGIPSAGLVMMMTILAALELPLEGAALLLAVDRPLDMMRTAVNVWSDSCGAAVIARSEGELGPLEAGSGP